MKNLRRLAFTALLAASLVPCAYAQEWKVDDIPFRTRATTNTNLVADSLEFNLIGGPTIAQIETSAVLLPYASTSRSVQYPNNSAPSFGLGIDLLGAPGQGPPTTAFLLAKVFVYAADGTVTGSAYDTTFIALDLSTNGSNWISGSFVGVPLVAAQDVAVGYAITGDSDAAQNAYGFPFWRLRVRPDGSGAALISRCRVAIARVAK